MAVKVVMEALSPTMEEGRLVEWKKQEGEPVAVGDVLAEVETDKAVMELVARAGGTLLKHAVAAGATVPVSQVVALIGEPGEQVDDAAPSGGNGARAAAPPKDAQGTQPAPDQNRPTSMPPAPAAQAAAEERRAPAEERGAPQPPAPPPPARPSAARPSPEPVRSGYGGIGSPAAPPSQVPAASGPDASPAPGGRVKASPLARRIAAERGIDLGGVAGSGPEGRVVARDLEGAAVGPPAAATAPAAATPAAAGAAGPVPVMPRRAAGGPPFEDVPLTQIRKTIARRLAQSIGPIPTFYLTTEVDMERAWEARAALNELAPDAKTSFNDIIVKATALALRQHQACNAWWQDDHIRYWHEVHIGMAVAVEDGLITPVVRDADLKPLRAIAAETRDLAGRARTRRLKPEEYTGSTFSVSNLGMLDIDEFTAVINPPEAGILAVGRIAERAVVHLGQVQVRRRLRLTMSCDHRVIDGATGAEFLRTLKGMLENPLAMVW